MKIKPLLYLFLFLLCSIPYSSAQIIAGDDTNLYSQSIGGIVSTVTPAFCEGSNNDALSINLLCDSIRTVEFNSYSSNCFDNFFNAGGMETDDNRIEVLLDNTGQLKQLALGDTISSLGRWEYKRSVAYAGEGYGFAGYTTYGNWFSNPSGYFAMRVFLMGDTLYGWGAAEQLLFNNGASLNVSEIAMESTTCRSPNAGFNPDQTNVCSGTSICFENTTDIPSNFSWDFGDGNGNNEMTPCHSYTSSGVYTVYLYASNGIGSDTAEWEITVLPSLTPSIMVNADQLEICSGESINFSAMAMNGGANPIYEWQVNGQIVGGNNSMYSSNSLENGDLVKCLLTSDAECAISSAVSSLETTIIVKSTVVPTIEVEADQNSICQGEEISFTAMATNGGANPIYEWQVNGQSVGGNSSMYSSNSFEDGDLVKCLLTSDAECATSSAVSSLETLVIVKSAVVPTIEVEANQSSICKGEEISFTAMATNGGGNPIYEWQVNDQIVGGNSNMYSSSSLVDGDVVKCSLTSDADCATSNTASSLEITVEVLPNVIPAVFFLSCNFSISDFCEGNPISFSADFDGGGSNPTFDWFVNGVSTGNNSNSYDNNNLLDGDTVICVMTSSAACASPVTAASESLIVNIHPIVLPTIEVEANQSSICPGEEISFTAVTTHEGNNPSYEWQINGRNVGSNDTTFTSSDLQHGDVVTCTLNSDLLCASQREVTSTEILITVNPIPSLSFDMEDTICMASQSIALSEGLPAGGTYSGPFVNNNMLDLGAIVSDTTINITYSYTDANGCSASVEEELRIVLCSATDLIENPLAFHFYPNPTSSFFTLDMPTAFSTIRLSIYSLDGKRVKYLECDAKTRQEIDVRDLASGLYIIQVADSDRVGVGRLVIN